MFCEIPLFFFQTINFSVYIHVKLPGYNQFDQSSQTRPQSHKFQAGGLKKQPLHKEPVEAAIFRQFGKRTLGGCRQLKLWMLPWTSHPFPTSDQTGPRKRLPEAKVMLLTTRNCAPEQVRNLPRPLQSGDCLGVDLKLVTPAVGSC